VRDGIAKKTQATLVSLPARDMLIAAAPDAADAASAAKADAAFAPNAANTANTASPAVQALLPAS